MHEERLRQLRRVVAAAPADRFVMDRFCTAGQPCGTAYCAAGWAALDPWMQKETPMLKYFALEDFDQETLVVPRDLRDGFQGLSTVFDLKSAETENCSGVSAERLQGLTGRGDRKY
jgi:hypothetical protein